MPIPPGSTGLPNNLLVSDDLDNFKTGDADQALAAALGVVRGYCGWHIAPVISETVSVWPASRAIFFLPTTNLVSVDAITQLGIAYDPATVVGQVNGEVRTMRGYWYLYSDEFLIVTFTHGFEALPDEVSQVALALAQRNIDNPGSRPQEQVGAVVATNSQPVRYQAPSLTLMPTEREILDAYRVPSI